MNMSGGSNVNLGMIGVSGSVSQLLSHWMLTLE
jgi:hypothetical protein